MVDERDAEAGNSMGLKAENNLILEVTSTRGSKDDGALFGKWRC